MPPIAPARFFVSRTSDPGREGSVHGARKHSWVAARTYPGLRRDGERIGLRRTDRSVTAIGGVHHCRHRTRRVRCRRRAFRLASNSLRLLFPDVSGRGRCSVGTDTEDRTIRGDTKDAPNACRLPTPPPSGESVTDGASPDRKYRALRDSRGAVRSVSFEPTTTPGRTAPPPSPCPCRHDRRGSPVSSRARPPRPAVSRARRRERSPGQG